MSVTSCNRAINTNIKVSLTWDKLFKNKIFVILLYILHDANWIFYILEFIFLPLKRLTNKREEEILLLKIS